MMADYIKIRGVFRAVLRDRPGGRVIARTSCRNIMVNSGKDLNNNSLLRTAVTVVGPYMGLINSATVPVAGDTMAAKGWTESTGYTGNRPTAAFNASSGGVIALTANLSFTSTTSETIYGAFIVTGTGALATPGNTAGTLYTAGQFGASQPWVSGNQLTVSYTLTLS